MTWTFWKKQKQTQDGTGVAVQAGQNAVVTINSGITATEARVIALDVFKANLLEFRGVAQNTAAHRGEEITDKFIEKLQNENPDGLSQAQEPDFQDALFTVQKEYAKAGDKDLGDLLVDLLVDRTKQDKRTILQIVLNESLHTAPKLTQGQIATLSLVFFMRRVRNSGANNLQRLATYYEAKIGSVIGEVATNDSAFQHLQFSGCGAISMGSISFGEILTRVYPGLFKVGFDSSRLEQANLSAGVTASLVIPCLNDPTKLQVAALDNEVLESRLNQIQISAEDRQKLKALFSEGTMAASTAQEKFLSVAPFMKDAADKWDKTGLKSFDLTSVGMAIGHANIKRTGGEFAPLAIWIN